jgi:hypothetical protein
VLQMCCEREKETFAVSFLENRAMRGRDS